MRAEVGLGASAFSPQNCTENILCAIEGARRGDPHNLGQGPPSKGGDQSRVLGRGQEEARKSSDRQSRVCRGRVCRGQAGRGQVCRVQAGRG